MTIVIIYKYIIHMSDGIVLFIVSNRLVYYHVDLD